MKAAQPVMAARTAPAAVFLRPRPMSRAVMPLSTEALCWKNSIQGVTVAPMLDTISIRNMAGAASGSGLQVAMEAVTAPTEGWANQATPTKVALNTARPAHRRSHLE